MLLLQIGQGKTETTRARNKVTAIAAAVRPAVFVTNRGQAAALCVRSATRSHSMSHLACAICGRPGARGGCKENERGLYSLLFDLVTQCSSRASFFTGLPIGRLQLNLDLGPWTIQDDYAVAEQPRDAAWHLTTRVQVLGPNDVVLYGWARPLSETLDSAAARAGQPTTHHPSCALFRGKRVSRNLGTGLRRIWFTIAIVPGRRRVRQVDS
jgi:hypothetical protein